MLLVALRSTRWRQLCAIAVLALFGCRSAAIEPAPGVARNSPSAAHTTTSASAVPAAPKQALTAAPGPLLPTGNADRDMQIARVVAAMDATGHPPAGVAQGGHPPGAFRNREGQLPRGPKYTESDIWPKRERGGRGTERLVFGAEQDVWVTLDHYAHFEKIR